MGKVDFNKYKSPETLVEVIQNRIETKANGNEFEACCPFHGENTPSFRIVPDKGFYYCFGCQAKGDALDFIMEFDGISRKAAMKVIDGGSSMTGCDAATRRARIAPVRDPYEGIELLTPPDGQTLTVGEQTPKIWNPKREKFTQYKPSMVFEYRGIDGGLLGYVLRIDFPDGVKITPTITWCKLHDNTEGWCHKHFDTPRPVYGQEYLEGSIKPILIVEGEKAADAADKLMGDNYDVVCWHGGTQSVEKTDWSFTAGKKVLLWSDMDIVGMKAMCGHDKNGEWKKGVGDLCLEGGAASVRYISLDESKEKGWDAADALAEGWTTETVTAWAKKFVEPYTKQEYSGEMPSYLHESMPLEFYSDIDYGEYGDNVVPLPVTADPVNWEAMLQMKDNKPDEMESKVSHNAIILMQYHPDMKGVLAYNENNHSIDVVSRTPWDDGHSVMPRAITDSDNINAKAWLETTGMRLGINDVRGAIISVADKRRYNPLKSYINSLSWDQIPRLDMWLHTYLGVPNTEYSRLVARKFLIGAIARGLKPGCKMDTMLILEGAQGVMKSTAIETLFGRQFYTDEIHNIGSKDAAMQMQGMWGIEVPEMHAMNRSEANQIKEWITRTVDRFRPPYGTAIIESPRSSVLIGTLNPEGGYLKDATGARRFLPVRCLLVDIHGLRVDRDQIWAEARHYFLDGESWWFTTDETALVAGEQEERYEGDSWSDGIDEYLIGLVETTVSDILEKALDIPRAQWTKPTEIRVGKHLQIRGWSRQRVSKGGIRHYVYFNERLS